MTLEYDIASLVNDKTVASELWAALQTHFEGMGLMAAAALAAKIWSYRILPDKDLAPQVQEIKSMAMKFNLLGFQFNEDLQAISILTALPPEWSTICSIILNKSGEFTLQGTIDALIEHEISL